MLKGKTICFTGTLVGMTRAEATKLAEKAGASVTGSVSGKTQIVVAGTDAGSKLDLAKAKAIPIWSIAEFKQNIASSGKKAEVAVPTSSRGKSAKKAKAESSSEEEEDDDDEDPDDIPSSADAPSCAADFRGKVVVFTGALKNMSRAAATVLAQTAGATVGSSVTGKTQIVVAGADAGSKLGAAKAKGIPIMSEQEFMVAVVNKKGGAVAAKPTAKKVAAKPAKQTGKKRARDESEEEEESDAESEDDAAPSGKPLAGKSLVFTGTLPVARSKASAMATAAGATVASSVSGKTNYLVAGEGAGAKMEAAEDKGVKVLSWAQFNKIISGGDAGGSDDDDDEDDEDDDDGEDDDEDEDDGDGPFAALGQVTGDETGHLPRAYYVGRNRFLRSTDLDDFDVPEELEPCSPEERASDKKHGPARDRAVTQHMQTAEKMEKLFTSDLIENNFFYFGYGETTSFCFKIPPKTKSGWNLNDVLHASHADGIKQVFEETGNLNIRSLTAMKADILDKIRDDDDDEDTKAKNRDAKRDVETLIKALKELAGKEEILSAEGENGNCDETIEFVYFEDRKMDIVYGVYVKKSW